MRLGASGTALELARGLQPYGCFVHLVVFGGKLSSAQHLELSLCENVSYWSSTSVLNGWTTLGKTSRSRPISSRRIAANSNRALFILMDMRLRRELAGRRRLLSVRTHVSFRGGERSCVNRHRRLGRYRDEVAAGLAAANAVIAPTQALLDVLEEIYRIELRGLVIRNGIDPKPFIVRDKVGQILSVGRVWDDARTFALLDFIAPEVAWPILIAGDAASPVSNRRSSFAHLRLLGKLNHSAVCQEMSRTAIYAAPAWYEPFGLAVLGAALSRCVDIGGYPDRELWRDAAILIEPSDARCWKAAFSKMLDDGPARGAGEAARKRALTLNRQLMSSAYYHLYRELSDLQSAEAQSAT